MLNCSEQIGSMSQVIDGLLSVHHQVSFVDLIFFVQLKMPGTLLLERVLGRQAPL